MTIEEAIRAGSGAVVSWLGGKDEISRRAAAPAVWKLYRSTSGVYQGPDREVNRACEVAVMGVATLAELRKERFDQIIEADATCEVLRDRRPDWLTEWTAFSLERQPQPLRWQFVRRLEREGLCGRPEGEGFRLGMILAAGREGALTLLEQDSTLLPEVWRLFEIEGAGEFSLAAFDKYTREDRTWAAGLAELSRRGVLDRSRLLDASLGALARDFEQFRAGWYSRFHAALAPTLEERQARVAAYVGLLGSRIGPTVSFALRALGGLSVELVEPLAPALTAREKGTALAALKLLAASPSPGVARVAAEGLGHAAANVQRAAWKLVDERGSPEDPALRTAVEERLDGLSATLAPRVRAWLGARAPAVRPAEPAAAEPAPAVSAVTPVAGVDELVELLSRLVESGEPALDLERALDGVARLGPEQPGRAAAPLLKRARQLAQRPRSKCQEEMARLALAWLAGESPPRKPSEEEPFAFLRARVDEVCARVLQGRPGPLAALPDRSDFTLGRVRAPLGPLDLTQALLRVRPDAALEPGLAGESLDAARFALGQAAPVGPTPGLWAAAARARCPLSDCPEVEARHPGLGRAYRCELRVVERYGRMWVDRSSDQELLARPWLPVDLLWGASGLDAPADRRWQATIWPHGRPAWWCQGWLALGNNLDWWEADWADVVYLESLLEPVPLEAHGRRLLAMGLSAKEPGQSGLAVDALAAALTQERVHPHDLATTLAELRELLKPARWARALSEVARLSDALAARVFALLERHLALAPPAGEPLELLLELGARLGCSPQDPAARQVLAALQGSGKAARAARAVLSLS